MTDGEDVVAIARDLVDFVLAAGRDAHPDGFAAYLESSAGEDVDADVDGRVVTDVLFPPPNREGGAFDVLGIDAMPRRAPVVGTVRTGRYADEPVDGFRDRGAIHVAAREPYDEITVTDADGEALDLPVVDAVFEESETELP